MTITDKKMVVCPKCKTKSRIIKVGLTQTKVAKQRYFCYSCRKQFVGPVSPHKNYHTNTSGVDPDIDP
jgi:transposase-like protein